jgi:hypothetical protein
MKIKCSKCLYDNLENSKYCQECGTELIQEEEEVKNKQVRVKVDDKKPLHKYVEEIDDVIFKPKKRDSLFKKILLWTLIICVLGFASLMLFAFLTSEDDSITTTQIEPTTFPISYLNIVDYEVIFDNYGESYFEGTLKNTYLKAARNVKVRLDFYYDEAMRRHFDTRNVTIKNGAEANGAFSFEIPLNFYPQDQFWWIWKIEGADYGLQ